MKGKKIVHAVLLELTFKLYPVPCERNTGFHFKIDRNMQ